MTETRKWVLSTIVGLAIGVVLFTLGYRMLTEMWPWDHL